MVCGVELAKPCRDTCMMMGLWKGMSNELAQRILMVLPSLTEVHYSHSGWITDATLAVYAHCPLWKPLFWLPV
jgi:hypothetical protein